jgi:hypothetical protein
MPQSVSHCASTPPPTTTPVQVALAQKWLIQKARLASRPVLVAGQLMEGMAAAPRPSRPEITDVVNAVYDGADCVVLMQVSLGGGGGGRQGCVCVWGGVVSSVYDGADGVVLMQVCFEGRGQAGPLQEGGVGVSCEAVGGRGMRLCLREMTAWLQHHDPGVVNDHRRCQRCV